MKPAIQVAPLGRAVPLDDFASPRTDNKLSNLQRLARLSESLQFEVPTTLVVGDEHFFAALDAVTKIEPEKLLIETLSAADGRRYRQALLVHPLPQATRAVLSSTFEAFQQGRPGVSLCVRSCFALEDRNGCSFAGAFETVHSVDSAETLFRAVQVVYASVFSERAMMEMRSAALSHLPGMTVAIQVMLGGPRWLGGVAHTQSPELWPYPLMLLSVSDSSASVTAGSGIPEDFLVFRDNVVSRRRAVVQAQPGSATNGSFSLADDDLKRLAQSFLQVEEAFETPVEIEWVLDEEGNLFLLQARPLTIDTRAVPIPTDAGAVSGAICTGLPVGNGCITARARRVRSWQEALHVPPGRIIVTENTDPDWVPAIRRCAGLVTAIGARTSHVARSARENGVPAVVGCGEAINAIEDGATITLLCADGLVGMVYPGTVQPEELSVSRDDAHVSNVAMAFTLGRNSQPRSVYFDLSDVLQSFRLPASHDDASVPPRIRRRIAGYPTIETFARQKLIEAVCLVSIAFPTAVLYLSFREPSSWSRLLPEVIRVCREQYGVVVRAADHPMSDALPRT